MDGCAPGSAPSLELERAFDHLAGIDRCVVDRPALLLLVLDQHVFAVEKEDVELLDPAMGDVRRAVINKLIPRADRSMVLAFEPHVGTWRRSACFNEGQAERQSLPPTT